MDALQIPGMGWTSPKKEVVVIKSDLVYPQSVDALAQFVYSNCAKYRYGERCLELAKRLQQELVNSLAAIGDSELHDSGLSGGRSLTWSILLVPPNTSFPLHAHPNIELIYALSGSIHELRYMNRDLPKTKFAPDDNDGPDMSAMSNSRFEFRVTSAEEEERQEDVATNSAPHERIKKQGGFLFNQKGSIHLSFTRDDGASLLVLWSGRHANIASLHYPPAHTMPELPEGGKGIAI